MTKPTIADIKPKPVLLEKGKEYFFCACGKSKSQPYCDGSHAGSDFSPLHYKAQSNDQAYICMCKQSRNFPYCDGSHKQFNEAQIGHTPDEEEQGEIITSDNKPVGKNTPEEPHVAFIHELANHGLDNVGEHGPMVAMGVPAKDLPKWDDLQIMTAQLETKPLMESVPVETKLVIGPKAKKPLVLETPIFVSDMSFGALSEEAKVSLATGAELAGTGICSGEGGMLPEEQQANSKYLYELASAQFGYDESVLDKVQAFHFKGGQGAKTGTGGHLPGSKNQGKVAKVRGINEGESAVSPPTFSDLTTPKDFKHFADRVREVSGGIPVGFKLSANHIERDIQFAIEAGADYIILDGRGGGTGAAPAMFRDHISVPTIPALARARRYLNKTVMNGRVTLIITGGLRTPMDFVKALALGADGIAIANSAIQAIGCVGARMCNTNQCPSGIATQQPQLRERLQVSIAAQKLERFIRASTSMMTTMARACGHSALSEFNLNDLETWQRDLAHLSGVRYGGMTSIHQD